MLQPDELLHYCNEAVFDFNFNQAKSWNLNNNYRTVVDTLPIHFQKKYQLNHF